MPTIHHCEHVAIGDKYTAIRSTPRLFECTLPFADWKIVCPSTATEELLLAQRPSLRVSVKQFKPNSILGNESEYLQLWQSLDGLLVLPTVEILKEHYIQSPANHLVLERQGNKRLLPHIKEIGTGIVWQLVTSRNYAGELLFFVVLSNWGSTSITAPDRDLFLKVMDSFKLTES